eukprot:Gb_07821 [translate_table: standard]
MLCRTSLVGGRFGNSYKIMQSFISFFGKLSTIETIGPKAILSILCLQTSSHIWMISHSVLSDIRRYMGKRKYNFS